MAANIEHRFGCALDGHQHPIAIAVGCGHHLADRVKTMHRDGGSVDLDHRLGQIRLRDGAQQRLFHRIAQPPVG